MTCTVLCRALCLLLCIKLEIPPYARPIQSVISDVIMPLFSFLILESFGKIKEILFVQILCPV